MAAIDDVNHIRNFIQKIPSEIRKIYDPQTTDFFKLIDNFPAETISGEKKKMSDLIIESASEVHKSTSVVLREVESRMKDITLYESFSNVGLTGYQLSLKGSIFTNLWRNLELLLGKESASFTNIALVMAAMESLSYLSDFLGSLVKVLPGLEQLKELVEILLALFNLIKSK